MAESIKSSGEKHSCSVCNATSDDRVLLKGEQKGEKAWVCVRCLPMLIHGGH